MWELSIGWVPILRREGDSPESRRGLRKFESYFSFAFVELPYPNNRAFLFLTALRVDDSNLLTGCERHGEEREASVRVDYDGFCGFFVKRRVRFRDPYRDWYCDLDALSPATARAVLVS